MVHRGGDQLGCGPGTAVLVFWHLCCHCLRLTPKASRPCDRHHAVARPQHGRESTNFFSSCFCRRLAASLSKGAPWRRQLHRVPRSPLHHTTIALYTRARRPTSPHAQSVRSYNCLPVFSNIDICWEGGSAATHYPLSGMEAPPELPGRPAAVRVGPALIKRRRTLLLLTFGLGCFALGRWPPFRGWARGARTAAPTRGPDRAPLLGGQGGGHRADLRTASASHSHCPRRGQGPSSEGVVAAFDLTCQGSHE